MRWYDKLFIGFMVSVVLAMFPLAYFSIQRDNARYEWCLEHGYRTTTVGGRSPSTVCVDKERRLILPKD